jgi:hypothetical protein
VQDSQRDSSKIDRRGVSTRSRLYNRKKPREDRAARTALDKIEAGIITRLEQPSKHHDIWNLCSGARKALFDAGDRPQRFTLEGSRPNENDPRGEI